MHHVLQRCIILAAGARQRLAKRTCELALQRPFPAPFAPKVPRHSRDAGSRNIGERVRPTFPRPRPAPKAPLPPKSVPTCMCARSTASSVVSSSPVLPNTKLRLTRTKRLTSDEACSVSSWQDEGKQGEMCTVGAEAPHARCTATCFARRTSSKAARPFCRMKVAFCSRLQVPSQVVIPHNAAR